MTNEELLNQIQRCIVGACDESCKYYNLDNKACCITEDKEFWDKYNQFKELTHRFTPITPTVAKLTDCVYNLSCPTCNYSVGELKKDYIQFNNFCPDCGQAIDSVGVYNEIYYKLLFN